jgi:SAM-dependent methyltransferase/methyltransferase-like protein
MTTLYDTVPYPRHAYGFTHPDQLATLATLRGLKPPPIERARVLELGCASGANLIPMAYSLPEAEFLGVDLSTRQIAEGQAFIAAVGLTNVRLEALDLQTIDDRFGQFDYIIAHGVYSWVPPEAQDAILRICGRQLRANGVALVSYNTLPGCHLRQMVRGMAQFHARDMTDPKEQVGQLLGLTRFLATMAPDDGASYTRILRSEAERLAKLDPAFLLHDVLEETNLPVYFHEFIAHAAAHGLQYVGEALAVDRRGIGLDPQVLAELRAAYSPLEFEQHLDFLDGTAFRRSLLCRAPRGLAQFAMPGEQNVPVPLAPASSQLDPFDSLLIASSARPTNARPDLHGPASEEFAVRKDRYTASLRADQPIEKAALAALSEAYPAALRLDALVRAAAGLLGRPVRREDKAQIRELVLGGFPVGVVELHCWQPAVAREASAMPTASPVARYEAAQGWEVTTLWHERFALVDPVARQLVAALDGQHDRAALVDLLMASMTAGGARFAGEFAPSSPADLRREISRRLAIALTDLARDALLIA